MSDKEGLDSILTSVKKKLGIIEEDEHFDMDLIIDINLAFAILTQIGVGPLEGFVIENKDNQWSEFVTNTIHQSLVREYVCLKTRVLFDSTMSSTLIDSLNREINQLEWRLQDACCEEARN